MTDQKKPLAEFHEDEFREARVREFEDGVFRCGEVTPDEAEQALCDHSDDLYKIRIVRERDGKTYDGYYTMTLAKFFADWIPNRHVGNQRIVYILPHLGPDE